MVCPEPAWRLGRPSCTEAGMWNQRYDTEEYVYGTEPNGFLAEACAQIPAGPVVCLGAGEGRNAVFLAERGARA